MTRRFPIVFALESLDASRHFYHFVQGAQAEVVRYAAVHEMRVLASFSIEIGAKARYDLANIRIALRTRFRRHEPLRALAALAVGMIAEHHGVEKHGHGRRGRHCASHRKGGNIGTKQIEIFLDEGKAHPVTQVRRIDEDQGCLAPLLQVAKGGVAEHILLVKLHGHLRPARAAEPQSRVEQPADQRSLNVFPQEHCLVIVKDAISV